MKKLALRFCLSCVLIAVFTASPAFAASKKKEEVPPPMPPVIFTVSAGSITVADAKVFKTYAINQFTEILVKGQRAKITDLQPGMSVSVTQGTDATKAARINAGDPPKR